MTDRTKTGLEILQAAFLVGILGNVLLRETPWGLGVFLFVTAFVAAIAMLAVRRRPELVTGQNIALAGGMVFFSAMFAWRDSIQLKAIDTFAIIILMGVLMLSSLKVKARIGGIFHYAIGVLWAGINSAFSPAILLSTDVKWNSIPKMGWSRHLIATIRGILIALPLVLVFGALFVAADAVYEGMVQRVFNVPSENVFSHLILTALFFWLTAGYFRGFLLGGLIEAPAAAVPVANASASDRKNEASNLSIFDQVRAEETVNPDALPNNASILDHINKSDPPNEPNAEAKPAEQTTPKSAQQTKKFEWQKIENSVMPPAFTLGVIETSVVLGILNLLFLSFVIVQVPYLFGGMDLVQNTPDFKLAEYARRGFGELVAVTVLVLPLLLATHWLLKKDNPLNEKVYRVLAGIQIVLLLVIMASAVQRLFLLTGSLGYGLTTVRFYPMVVMIWFAIVFVWFGATVLRGARKYFAWGALWSAIFVLAGVHVLNPDDFIVRTNIALMKQGREFDAYYNAGLSTDAIPALLESLPEMDAQDRCEVGSSIHYTYRELGQRTDLRSLNYSSKTAFWKLRASDELLHQTEDCPPYLHNDKNPAGSDIEH